MNVLGHAGYAEEGEDIVCAGISALGHQYDKCPLSIFTEDAVSADPDEETVIDKLIVLDSPAGHDANLLMKSLVLRFAGNTETIMEMIISF